MTDEEEWGPWIEHDGKGCPCVGMFVQAVLVGWRLPASHGRMNGSVWEGRATGVTSWKWPDASGEITRYRIRKPRALRDLIKMVENLPVPERVDA